MRKILILIVAILGLLFTGMWIFTGLINILLIHFQLAPFTMLHTFVLLLIISFIKFLLD